MAVITGAVAVNSLSHKAPGSDCSFPVTFSPSVWEVGTGGEWNHDERWGRYRYFVIAEGREHVQRNLLVEILEYSPDGAPSVAGCVDTGRLATEDGWFMTDLAFSRSGDRTYLSMGLAMVERVQRRELHILELRPDGRAIPVIEAPEFLRAR